MIQSPVTITNKLGLHARASAKLSKLAGSFPCEVWLSRAERRVNAKSIMGVMMIAAELDLSTTVATIPVMIAVRILRVNRATKSFIRSSAHSRMLDDSLLIA